MGEETGPLKGGCNCGAVRYEISGAPLAVAACHCVNCRKQSGAAFSVNLVVRASTMTVQGALAAYQDHGEDSGTPIAREFCPACGSPIRSIPSASPKMIAVKAGTLDAPDAYGPQMHIWTKSALAWVAIPENLPCFDRGPRV
jgi:hypothetical protein